MIPIYIVYIVCALKIQLSSLISITGIFFWLSSHWFLFLTYITVFFYSSPFSKVLYEVYYEFHDIEIVYLGLKLSYIWY